MTDLDSLIHENEPLPESVPEVSFSVRGPEKTLVIGDTFDVVVSASWAKKEATLLLVPSSSVSAKGLDQVAVRQVSGRKVQGGEEFAESRIIYTVVATDTGTLEVPVLKILLPTPEKNMEFRTEPFSVTVRPEASPVIVTAVCLFLVCVLGIVTLFGLKRRRFLRQKNKAEAFAREELRIRDDFFLLKQRVQAVETREWLLSLEKICKSWGEIHFHSSDLESLAKEKIIEGWDTLLAEFAHARYGGVFRESFMNLETWKTAARLMGMEQED